MNPANASEVGQRRNRGGRKDSKSGTNSQGWLGTRPQSGSPGHVFMDFHALLVRDASGGIFPTNTHALTLVKQARMASEKALRFQVGRIHCAGSENHSCYEC